MMASHSTDPLRWEMRRVILGRYRERLPKVDAAVLLRHIDHAVKTIGADHVGLGSDFDGVSGMVPAGVEDTSKYPVVVKGLMELGYSDTDIRKIMGENLLRVLGAAATTAAEMGGR